MSHEDELLRTRFASLEGALAPTEGALAAVDRAVARRRQRPRVIGASLAGVAAVAVAGVGLQLAGELSPRAASAGAAPSIADGATRGEELTRYGAEADGPVAPGSTLEDWARKVDVLVVVLPEGEAARVLEVSWQREDAPRSFELEALPLDQHSRLELSHVDDEPSEATLSPASDHLLALRWVDHPCGGAEPGWGLLDDGAVLEMEDGRLPGEPVEEPAAQLEAPVDGALAGLSGQEVGEVLEAIGAARSPDTCE